MINNKKELYIINTNYPYGKTETFLENEVVYLSNYFEKIYLFPLNYPSKDFYVRDVPNNVVYKEASLSKNNYKRLLKFLFKYSPSKNYLIDLINIVKSGNGHYSSKLKRWFLSFLVHRAFYNSDHYHFIKKNIKPNDVLYFYWGGSKSLYASQFKHSNTFIRVHGGEINLERGNGYIPLFDKLFNKNVTYLAISKKINNQILGKIPQANVLINRLGTFDYGLGPIDENNPKIRIVSCSNVIPLKRVDLIFKALKLIENCDVEIDWVHFGDGPLLNELEIKSLELNKNITTTFKGRTLNKNVLQFYKKNQIDLFINVSTTEGVPVSIMEALSFGIPCFCTNVGATSEIINDKNGVLVEKNFDINLLSKVIIESSSNTFKQKRFEARRTWEKLCNAKINYDKLVNIFYNDLH